MCRVFVGRRIRSGTVAALCELITARRIIENGELIIIFRQLFIDVNYSQSRLLTRRLITASRMRGGRPRGGAPARGTLLCDADINMEY